MNLSEIFETNSLAAAIAAFNATNQRYAVAGITTNNEALEYLFAKGYSVDDIVNRKAEGEILQPTFYKVRGWVKFIRPEFVDDVIDNQVHLKFGEGIVPLLTLADAALATQSKI